MKRNLFILSLMLSVLVLVGCPVVVGPTTPTIKVTPPSVTLEKNKSQIFKAEMSDGTSATFGWLVLPGNGTLSSTTTPSVNYTAPATAGNYKITVDSSTASIANTVNIKVVDLVSVVVTPSAVTVAPGDTVTLNAALDSAKDSTFTWEATGGTLSANVGKTVTFTAPAALGIYQVIVKSPDASKDGIANIQVVEALDATSDFDSIGSPLLNDISISSGVKQPYVIDAASAIFNGVENMVIELDTSSPIKLSVFDESRNLVAVSDNSGFFTATGSSTTSIESQALTVRSSCLGPCVIIPNPNGSSRRFYIQLESDVSATYDLYAYADVYKDKSEPGSESDCKIITTASGEPFALETLGDKDCINSGAAYNRVKLTTLAKTAMAVEAKVYDKATNGLLDTLNAGLGADSDFYEFVGTPKEFKIVVGSSDGRAGNSGTSEYQISFNQP